ncbi:MAG: MFS transporter [Mesorhizobium sp.]|nr:MFS transporter [Mesorhizobium sp.]
MGFGLFLPEFKSEFAFSTQAAGLLSSLGFLGFLGGLLGSQIMTNRDGPRRSIICGLAVATIGMAIIAAAPNMPILAVGVLLSMSSAGFSWTPFNNAIHRKVEEGSRPAALSLVSTGTSLGIAVAGTAALLMSIGGVSWRFCWAMFAIASAVALLSNWFALRQVAGTPGSGPSQKWSLLLRGPAIPLLGIGFSFGVISSIYISFAADQIVQAGGVTGLPANASGGLVFICYGFFGLIGLFTGTVKAFTGLPWLLRTLLLASALSAVLVALVPTNWASAVLSAGLQGIFVMMMSAVLAFWSERLFPASPSQGFTGVLLAVAAGSVIGPAAAGIAADALGPAPMFLGTAALALATVAAIRTAQIRESSEAA